MDVTVCGRPGGDSADYADLAIVAPFGVVLLDGASAFEPVDVSPVAYVKTLGKFLTASLSKSDHVPVSDAVATAIAKANAELRLKPGASPSSTVSVLRARKNAIDLYVLGDTPIYYGRSTATQMLSDERLAAVAQPERERYRDRLRAGYGYDDEHRVALAALQRAERRSRNVEGGYWIAETLPSAAKNGILVSVDRDTIDWAVLATDGASKYLNWSRREWSLVAQYSEPDLDNLLEEIHAWERDFDPDGLVMARAKRHDDKTVATVRFS
ncbi:MAG: hypothetical protein J0I34_08920 [Pseudonocardia sp.]|uniref:hypothetical protein n=1 Tax=Pseudonocardia sp. TaxID=60912 RepID=UPI001AD098C3|nr:hypothetical protein [Pseudonocardia sp.]MBN9108891.1 hypothetical protein [Pseudonocardia sp.]